MSSLLTGTAVEGHRALRGLAASPGFSIGVVLVLGIAIAGTVTVATAAYELFLRPLPFPRSEQLVQITMHSRSMGFDVGFAPPMLVGIREEPMVADLAAWSVCVLLAIVVLAAGLWPAERAARIQPTEALHHE